MHAQVYMHVCISLLCHWKKPRNKHQALSTQFLVSDTTPQLKELSTLEKELILGLRLEIYVISLEILRYQKVINC